MYRKLNFTVFLKSFNLPRAWIWVYSCIKLTCYWIFCLLHKWHKKTK